MQAINRSPINPADYIEEIGALTETGFTYKYKIHFKDAAVQECPDMAHAQEVVYWWYERAIRMNEDLPIKRLRGPPADYDGRGPRYGKSQASPKWSVQWHEETQSWSVTTFGAVRKFFESIDIAMEYLTAAMETYERSRHAIDTQHKIKDTAPPDTYGDW